MGKYLVKKIGNSLLTLFGVITVVFFLFNVLPGDPALMMLGQNENKNQLEIIKSKYGFNQVSPKQMRLAIILNAFISGAYHASLSK